MARERRLRLLMERGAFEERPPRRIVRCGQLCKFAEAKSKSRLYVMHLSLSSPSIQSQLLGILNRFDTSPGLLGDDGAEPGLFLFNCCSACQRCDDDFASLITRCQSRFACASCPHALATLASSKWKSAPSSLPNDMYFSISVSSDRARSLSPASSHCCVGMELCSTR